MPAEQLGLGMLWQSVRGGGGAVAPALVLLVYCLVQLGHALDEASEKLAAAARRRVLASTVEGGAPRWAMLVAVSAFEFHVLGDYYTAYWYARFRRQAMRPPGSAQPR